MNFNYIDNNNFIIKINSNYLDLNKVDLKESIKNILINIKKRYAADISGFYNVDFYEIKELLYILVFNRIEKDNLFYKVVDLKIVKHSKDIPLLIDDFLINKNILDKKDIYKLCEHYMINLQ